VALEGGPVGEFDRDRKPVDLRGWRAGARARLSTAISVLSPTARFALGLAFLAAVLLGISALLSLPSATLKLVCRHDFRSADITVSIDGEIIHTDTVTGAVRKRFGVLEKTEGTYTRTLPVGSGRHLVEVRLRAPGYDHTRSIPGDFRRGKESTLSVDSGRDLSLTWRGAGSGASAAEPASSSSSWFKYAGSVFMTIFGSIVSASIGVLVQDFLRARKARLGETGRIQPQGSKLGS
jgi:hypothetical protein